MKRSVERCHLNKLTSQVLVLTILFIILEMSYAITCTFAYTGHFVGSTTFDLIDSISLFLCYIMPMIMPFACFLDLFTDFWPRLTKPFNSLLGRDQGRRYRGRGGWGRISPSCFGKFGHSFLRFWKKIYIKFSPILGEDIYKFFFEFG